MIRMAHCLFLFGWGCVFYCFGSITWKTWPADGAPVKDAVWVGRAIFTKRIRYRCILLICAYRLICMGQKSSHHNERPPEFPKKKGWRTTFLSDCVCRPLCTAFWLQWAWTSLAEGWAGCSMIPRLRIRLASSFGGQPTLQSLCWHRWLSKLMPCK